jgi:hypothetical protein
MHQLVSLLSGKLRTTAVLSFFCLSTLLAGNAFATDWYVSAANGNDQNNTGKSTASPYRTIQKAADNAVSGDVVYVRTGTYREQVDIKANGVTFQPYNGETVTINGTDLLTTWTLESGSTYKTTMDWNVDANWGTNQLFQDGTMIEWARWPDQTSSDIVMPSTAKAEGVTASGNYFTITDNEFNEPAGRWDGAKIWVNLSLGGLDGQGWTGKVVSTSGNTITVDFLEKPRFNEAWQVGTGTEYFLFDPAPAKVTASGGVNSLLGPGEWWKDGNTLYVKTRNGSAPNASGTGTNVIEAKRRHFAFWCSTTRHSYTIKDFNLFACAVTTDKDAKTNKGTVDAAHDITLDGLKVKYVSHQTVMSGNWQAEHQGWTGIVLSGRNNTIKNCDIQYSATTALTIQGVNNKVLNNRIHDTNYMISNSGALNTGSFSEDSEIGYNRIWNTPMIAIHFKFFRNSNPAVRGVARIHHNEIFDYMRRAGDSGAIDMVGQDLQWVRIDHNYIYNTFGHDETRQASLMHGIYLDFGGSGQKIRAIVDHNVVTNAFTPMLLNDGTEVEAYNNVFIGNNRTDVAGNANYSIGNYNDQNGLSGRGNNVFNNILSHPPNIQDALKNINYINNIDDAKPGSSVLTDLFVNPVLTGTDRSIENFRLKDNSVTRARAIDKGNSLGDYKDGVQTGNIPDLGAFEWGSISTDNASPSTPEQPTVTNLTNRSFTLTWTPSTDDVGVAFYELTSSQLPTKKVSSPTVSFTGLLRSTDYSFSLVAVDRVGNRSSARTFTVRTPDPVVDVTIPKTTTAATIDGTREASVYTGPVSKIEKLASGTAPTSAADLSANWTAAWDASNLYIHVAVTDDIRKNDSDKWYGDDNVEIFINGDGQAPEKFGTYDFQYYIRPGESTISEYVHSPASSLIQVSAPTVSGTNNYTVEVKIPFSVLGISTPAELQYIGIDVNIGDDDGLNGTSPSRKMVWKNESYTSPSLFGIAQLTGSNTTTTLRDPENPSNAVNGLDYKYYEGTWSTLPSFGSLTAVKTGTSTTGFDLSTRNKDDYFGYQFTGYVNIPSDGTYTFYTSSDDGSKLYIGTTEVVNNDGLHASVEKSGSIGLKAGKHAITVVFFENGGGQSLSVSYSGPNLSKQTIPTSALYRAGTASTTVTDRTDPVGTGTITSRGQIADYEGREKAFDNDVNTKWLDQSAQSWIQYTFAGSAKYAVSKYSITSANDVPERDPRDWKLYGSNVANPVFPGDFTEVDSRSNVTFDSFKQKKEFTTSSSSTAYRTYRLTITANRGNGTPAIIQLSEIELFAPDCSTCRLASAEVESSELSLQLHPNPANQEVTISLAGFEAESSVEVKMSDMRGQSFLHRQVQPRVAGKQVTLSVGQLPQGLFFVTVQGSKARKTAKLVITK